MKPPTKEQKQFIDDSSSLFRECMKQYKELPIILRSANEKEYIEILCQLGDMLNKEGRLRRLLARMSDSWHPLDHSFVNSIKSFLAASRSITDNLYKKSQNKSRYSFRKLKRDMRELDNIVADLFADTTLLSERIGETFNSPLQDELDKIK